MESDDVCIVRDGTATMHYKTMEAFLTELENAESLDADVKKNVFSNGEFE